MFLLSVNKHDDKGVVLMNVNWQPDTGTGTETRISAEYCYVAASLAKAESDFDPLIVACVDKAVSQLADNINDESRYLIFEFGDGDILKIVVSDDSKTQDSAHSVVCDMSAMRQCLAESTHWKFKDESFAEIVKHGIRDYLTTCSGFMRYSLVAIFCETDRTKTELI
ncbi:hypothetical protein [Zhongshania sp. BJYM1]|uniref:hypothetical protein n=1 Tax=Zhongshania aquatica TaxID=2965069 RepID=UPI0022B371BB|nr:hypothetical protein [Marortus sp. BJYM1]